MTHYLTFHFLCILIALVIFILATLNAPSRFNLVAMGLAFIALSFLAGCAGGSIHYRDATGTAVDYDYKGTPKATANPAP